MIKLWGRANSSNVMKVIWLLEELRLPYTRVDVGGPFGGTATPEYRAMQPLGLVPALEEEGGFHLFESNVILRYLCNAHAPSSPLYPAAPRPRAEVEAWMEFQQTAINRPMSAMFLGLIRTPPAERDHAAIKAGIAEAAKLWAIVEHRLATMPYLAGSAFTLADIPLGIHVHRWLNMDLPDRPDCPHLAAWYGRLLQRAPYKQHCAGAIT